MKLFEYEFNGVVYDVETTLRARAELEALGRQRTKNIDMAKYAEKTAKITELTNEVDKAEKLKGKAKDEKLAELNKELLAITSELQPMILELEDSNISAEETVKTCLKYGKHFKGNMTNDFWFDFIYDMEEKMGADKMTEVLEEASQKVFMEIQRLREIRENKAQNMTQDIKM